MEFNIVRPTKEQLEEAAKVGRPELLILLGDIAFNISEQANELAGMHTSNERSSVARERRERRLATDIWKMAHFYVRISKLLIKKPIDKPRLTRYDNNQYIREHGAS